MDTLASEICADLKCTNKVKDAIIVSLALALSLTCVAIAFELNKPKKITVATLTGR